VDELEEAFKQRPKALILCNPSNPSGKVFTLEELKTIAYFAEKYDTFVITDEVYEHIVYPPHHHIYFASLPGCLKEPYLAVPVKNLFHHRMETGVFDCTLLHC